MNNFEEAIQKIEALEEENLNLKVKLKSALWKLSSAPVGATVTSIQVGLSDRVERMKCDAAEAMARFTLKIKSEAKKHREKKDGS